MPRKQGTSLLPREHGAYAQVSFPLLTALALGGLGPAALLLTVAVITVFLAHEPVLVLAGGRGGRAKRETSAHARRRLVWLVAVGLPAGLLGLWLANPTARLAALIPAALGALLTPLIFARREKTATGELLVAVTLSATMIPIAVAGGVSLAVSIAAATVWAVAFSLGTITVRAIIARAKKTAEAGWAHLVAPALSAAAIGLAVALAVADGSPRIAAVAVIPTALVSLVFGLIGIHPRNLRRMGWSLVASNVAVLAALIVGLR
jgi:hypothetical protein